MRDLLGWHWYCLRSNVGTQGCHFGQAGSIDVFINTMGSGYGLQILKLADPIMGDYTESVLSQGISNPIMAHQ